jgi:hypothetical protein
MGAIPSGSSGYLIIKLTVLPDCSNVKIYEGSASDVVKYDISSKKEISVSLNEFTTDFSTSCTLTYELID